MTPDKPTPAEYAPYYEGYISAVSDDDDVVELLERQAGALRDLARQVPAARETFQYAPDKWTVREVIGHLNDAERVFGYRVVCLSRGERASLPGFDENAYVAAANFNARTLQALVDEFALLRGSNVSAMRALDADAWMRTGLANNTPVSVRALAYIMAGHVNHHLQLLHARYGVSWTVRTD
jgi:hypothetical protein